MSPSQPAPPSKAGITQTADGQRVIPSSLRPDGSARREIRVRPGYRPPEDVEVYKNRNAEAWKNRGSGGVPGADVVQDPVGADTSAGNKNAKRRAARKKAKESTDDATPTTTTGDAAESNTPVAPAEKTAEEIQEEIEKKAKAIRKKIRQANDLKKKREDGDSLLPEQLEKVIKMNELIRQLNALGFEE